MYVEIDLQLYDCRYNCQEVGDLHGAQSCKSASSGETLACIVCGTDNAACENCML